MHVFAFDDPGVDSADPDAAAASSAYFTEGASGVGPCVHVCVCVCVCVCMCVWLNCEGAWMVEFILGFDSYRRRVGVPVILELGSHSMVHDGL